QDVEDALANDYYLRKREGALSDAVSSSADSVKFGRHQLEQGQADMFTILRLTGENLAAKIQLTQVRASRLRERVNLDLALGGDFSGNGLPKSLSSAMRVITNDYRDAQVMNLGSESSPGPYLVTHNGVSPNDPRPKTRFFVLRPDGYWVDFNAYACQGKPE